MSEVNVQRFLRKHFVFRDIQEDRVLEEIAASMVVRVFQHNDFVIRRGDVGRAMFFVLKGVVEVISEDGETIINLMREGSFFGEIGILYSVRRTVSCRTRSRCILLSLTKSAFTSVISRYPVIASNIASVAEERYASYLQQRKAFTDIKFGEELRLSMTQNDLRRIPLFRRCDATFLHTLALSLRPVQFAAHHVFIERGARAESMFFIVQGVAEVFDPASGECYAELPSGSFVGEVALLFDMPRIGSVRCRSSVLKAFELRKETLETILQQHPEVHEQLRDAAKQRLAFMQERENARLHPDQMAQADLEVIAGQLRKVPLLATCPSAFLYELALTSKIMALEAREVIIRQGDIGTCMYLVMSGAVQVVSRELDVVFATLEPYAFFGEIALFFEVARTATVMTREPSTIMYIPRRGLDHVLKEYVQLRVHLQERAAANLAMVQRRREGLHLHSMQPQESFTLESTAFLLRRIPLFRTCDNGFLHSLALTTTIRTYGEGEMVFQAADPSDCIYIILHGLVDIMDAETGALITTEGEGDYFGEVGVLRGIPRTATVRVTSPTLHVLLLPTESMRRVLTENPDIYQTLTLEAERRYAHTHPDAGRKEGLQPLPEAKALSTLQPSKPTRTRRLSAGLNHRTIDRPALVLPRSPELGAVGRPDETSTTTADTPPSPAPSLRGIRSVILEPGNPPPRPALLMSPLKLGSTKNVTAYPLYYRARPGIAEVKASALEAVPEPGPCPVASLSTDVLFRIFRYLTVADKCRSQRVCTRWREVLVLPKGWGMLDCFPDFRALTAGAALACMRLGGASLRFLNLRCCFQLEDVHVAAIPDLAPNLTTLSLSQCWRITDVGVAGLARGLVALQSLDLSFCGNVHGRGLLKAAWEGLCELDLSYCKKVEDSELEGLVITQHRLTRVAIRRCSRITDFGVFCIVRHCKFLRSLDISEIEGLTDKCIKWVASSSFQLAELRLRFSHITQAGFVELAAGSQAFRELDFSFCTHCTDAAMARFRGSLQHVRRLGLRHCQRITDRTAAHVAQYAPRLRMLDVSGTQVTEAARSCWPEPEPEEQRSGEQMQNGRDGPIRQRLELRLPLPPAGPPNTRAVEVQWEALFSNVRPVRRLSSPNARHGGREEGTVEEELLRHHFHHALGHALGHGHGHGYHQHHHHHHHHHHRHHSLGSHHHRRPPSPPRPGVGGKPESSDEESAEQPQQGEHPKPAELGMVDLIACSSGSSSSGSSSASSSTAPSSTASSATTSTSSLASSTSDGMPSAQDPGGRAVSNVGASLDSVLACPPCP